MSRLLPDAGRVPGPELLYLTTSEVSDVLDVAIRTLEVWEEDGTGPPRSSLTTSNVVYERDALIEWIDSHYSGDPGVDRSGDRMLRRQGVAEMVRVSVQTLERYQSGTYAGLEGPPVIRISRSTVRYWESDVTAWVRSYVGRRQAEGSTRGGEGRKRVSS